MSKTGQITWFQDARFGLFLHWGLYSVLAGEYQGRRMDYIGEWIMSKYRIPNTEYAKLAAQFNPQGFDADEWVRLAKRAGMHYVVITAKHHEGFAMYRSQVDPYNIVDATPFGRDPLAELAEACRKHGLKLGLYYSQDLDWHEPDGGDPGPDFPLNFDMSWGNDWDFPDYAAKNYASYFEKKVKPQVKELLTNYGEICLVWFDCPLTINRAQSEELLAWVHRFQPDCLVNTRLGNGLGDYGSMGDNQVPVGRVEGVWETPATLNDTWGYKTFDHNWKSAADTLGVLAGLASKNVNYLLNIGPQPDGKLPPESVQILDEIGDWMEQNGEAIHGTRQNPFPYDFDWGWITARQEQQEAPARLYCIAKEAKDDKLCLNGLRSRVKRAYDLANPARSIAFEQAAVNDVDSLCLELPVEFRGQRLPVIGLELEDAVDVDQRLIGQPGGKLVLPAVKALLHVQPGRQAAPGVEQTSGMSLPAGGAEKFLQEALRQPPRLDHTGSLVNWLDARDWVSWEVCIPQAGTYAVQVVTQSIEHSRPWKGGHRIRLEVEGEALECTLEQDIPDIRPETRCYPRAASRCGELHFGRAGCQMLALKPLEIQSNGGIGLVLVGVRLELLA